MSVEQGPGALAALGLAGDLGPRPVGEHEHALRAHLPDRLEHTCGRIGPGEDRERDRSPQAPVDPARRPRRRRDLRKLVGDQLDLVARAGEVQAVDVAKSRGRVDRAVRMPRVVEQIGVVERLVGGPDVVEPRVEPVHDVGG